VKKFTTITTSTTKKPTKPDLKSMTKAQKPINLQSSNENINDGEHDSSKKSKHFSKIALDSLLSRNKNSKFSPNKFQDSNDYLEQLNDNQASDANDEDENDEEYDDEDDDEMGTIHKINSDTDPNKLLHALTNPKNSISDDISHFSNSQTKYITRKPQISHDIEDIKHTTIPLPGPPRAVQAPIIKPRFVTLNWLEPVKNPDEVVSYTVYYKLNAPDAR
jgi:hypothetical protein